MCGIAGWVDWERDLSYQGQTITRMANTMALRGPDALGVWLSRHAALGHRRLIVVDPEGGGQPMTRRVGDRTYVLVYNGELYNTPEIRSELESEGHTFQSHSDTEALLLAYIEWGPGCLDRLNGIFAFGVFDEHDQTLFLARDRLGVKPLFYADMGGALLFGSEPKAILAHPEFSAEIRENGLCEVFGLGPARTPGCGIYEGLHELRPGWCLHYSPDGLKLRRYWALESREHTDSLEETAETVQQLLRDSVERQLVADVPVCTFLSGGLDSSAITTFAAAAFRSRGIGRLHTYSIDYLDNDRYFKADDFQPNSDAPWAAMMSDFAETEHHRIIVDTPKLVEALSDAVRAKDMPGMADIDSSLLLFCREVKKGATVALSGECADEIFGGYPWFHRADALESDTFPWSRAVSARTNVLSPELRQRIDLVSYVQERYEESLSEVPRLEGEDPVEARRREVFYLNMVWFMATLLDRKDRMSMGTGLEVRVPFCDHRLVQYVWNIPFSMKACDGREKGILRRALRGILPDEIIYRRKSPYPKTHNPSYFEAVRDLLMKILDDPSSPLLPLIDTAYIRELADGKGKTFGQPWFGQLMRDAQLFAYLIQMNVWLREYGVTLRL